MVAKRFGDGTEGRFWLIVAHVVEGAERRLSDDPPSPIVTRIPIASTFLTHSIASPPGVSTHGLDGRSDAKHFFSARFFQPRCPSRPAREGALGCTAALATLFRPAEEVLPI